MIEDRVTIRRAPGRWVMRAAGAILAETNGALEVSEGEMPPVIYFPREDAGLPFLDPSDHVTENPARGRARHWHIAGRHGRIENAAWSYDTPREAYARIAGYVAFAPEKTTVEPV